MKKGILKTMSKFGIGPTLSNLSSANSTASSTTNTQPQILINSNTNTQILSSPKQQLRSPQNKMMSQTIECSVTHYSNRSSQLVNAGHHLNRTNSQENEVDSFLLPALKSLPEFLLSNESDDKKSVHDAFIRCVNVPFKHLNRINLVGADSKVFINASDNK